MSQNDKSPHNEELRSELTAAQVQLNTAQARILSLEDQLQKEPIKVEIQGTKRKDQSPAISALIKEQLLLISFLIFSVGIISTHTYYAVFGIKYQFLDLPTFHIVYHGLIILVDAPYLLIPYAIAVAWLAFDSYTTPNGWHRFARFRNALTYLLIAILLIITYPLSQLAGRRQADDDLHEGTSTLPKIVNMELANGEKYGLGDQYRLFVVDSTYVIIFKPLDPGDKTTLPNIKRFTKGGINVIETIR